MPTEDEDRGSDEIDLESLVAKFLERQRRLNNWTYEELALRLSPYIKVHPSALQKVVKGTRRITVNELAAYAKTFSVPAVKFLDEAAWKEPVRPSADLVKYSQDQLYKIKATMNRRTHKIEQIVEQLEQIQKDDAQADRSLAIQIQKIESAKFGEGIVNFTPFDDSPVAGEPNG
ncbi:helix-turn-helix domain-containing protein [Cryobacterium sp. TMS1-20-1]|uniref:helix-turn-helix domain-containing protein n=1 Tax=Cryobacterium sp. TMS1-20-1 TaxID=1259223 RepID=UPI00141A96CA|nr:helix-turn-helix transcriptional regulator [Cryobacterium sp. TMS1-20-1]